MKRFTIGMVALGVALLAVSTAHASLTATIVNPLCNNSSSLLLASTASSFNVTIQLQTDEPLTALLLKLQDVTSGEHPSSYFTINSVTFAFPAEEEYQWHQPTGPEDPLVELPSLPQELNAGNSYTSGAIGDVPEAIQTGIGTFDFATLNISLSNPVIGQEFYLNLADIAYGDSDGFEQAGSAGANFHVTVVPAPGATVLGMIGLGMVAWVRRYSQRKRAAAM